jgi:predicted amidohydrolase YtcJ
LGEIASRQANHTTSDGPFVVQRLGQRRAKEGAHAWRRLFDAEVIVINSTDMLVEKLAPNYWFYSSVMRRMAG